jgi:phenylacetate-CoA ligase
MLVRFHGIFVDQKAIRAGQIIQEALDHIRVIIVPAAGFSAADHQVVIQRVRQRLGANIKVSIDIADQIPRTAAGKFRAVICNLPREVKEALRQRNR